MAPVFLAFVDKPVDLAPFLEKLGWNRFLWLGAGVLFLGLIFEELVRYLKRRWPTVDDLLDHTLGAWLFPNRKDPTSNKGSKSKPRQRP